ncbi:MAG: exodeoxyribonuclease large subunit [Evtepia sp.]|nr:exodeoxyribonuclease large subunit [Evtepia sp.]
MGKLMTVSELNHHIKFLIDEDRLLSNVLIQGELSNYKTYPSGHHYFSLKDVEGSIRCVMFRREASLLRFRPENGMNVIVGGRVTVFPRDGQYQLYCNRMMPDGIGDLHIAFEQIKEKLQKEGLFDQTHKKPIPVYPERIAVITSPVGAAVQDMIRVLSMRYPLAKVIVVPVRVQGVEAPGEIERAIFMVNHWKTADLIITGRGGGSMEDLWAFNEETVARAIYQSEIPIISAVGHEPDVTIADYVADLRAATPSNAAELAVPDCQDLNRQLSHIRARMETVLHQKVTEGRRILDRAERSPWLREPLPVIQESRHLLDYQEQKLTRGLERSLTEQRTHFGRLAASLDALSPLKVLGRGYSMVIGEGGALATSIRQIDIGQELTVQMADGRIVCRAERKEHSNHGREKTFL